MLHVLHTLHGPGDSGRDKYGVGEVGVGRGGWDYLWHPKKPVAHKKAIRELLDELVVHNDLQPSG